MLFVPYTADLRLAKVPWLTIAVSVLCLAIYAEQSNSDDAFDKATAEFCSGPQPRMFEIGVLEIAGTVGSDPCQDLLSKIYFSNEPTARIKELLAETPAMAGLDRDQTHAYLATAIERQYRAYSAYVPADLTQQLWFLPSTFNPWRMITSSFAHADWSHVIFNLIFFVAFAATVEVCIGWASYVAIVLGSSLFIGCSYALMSILAGEDVPTLGLSGVVMTMMTLLAFLLPKAKIRCFAWFVFFFWTIPVPVWLLALWYVGHNVSAVLTPNEGSTVNFLAHVAGAAFGYLVGVLFFQDRKTEVRQLARVGGVYA